jgi:hypothetical protein
VVNRILFAPAIKLTADDERDQVAHPPVDEKASFTATIVVFTCNFKGRLVVPPFAYLNFNKNKPAAGVLTVHSI